MKAKLLYAKFILIFFFSLGMIIWTIYQTSQAGVGKDNDEAFLDTYHNVDANYNKLVLANNKLNSLYDITFYFNDTVIDGISHEDVFLAQRAVNLRKTRKDMLQPGKNSFKVLVKEKESNNLVQGVKINMLVTMATTHDFDKKLLFKNGKSDQFDLKNRGFWNITGSLEIAGLKGHFFIKTNSK